MATRRSDAYFRVFSFFLTQPKQRPARRGSFEYMEMAVGGLDKVGEEEEGKDDAKRDESLSEEAHDTASLDDKEEYLLCIDTSQSHDKDKLFPHNPSCSSRDESGVQQMEWNTDPNTDFSSSDVTVLETSTDNTKAEPVKRRDEDLDLHDDLLVIEPDSFLSSDEEIFYPEFDPRGGSTYSNACVLNWSTEALSSHSFMGSLSRVDTLDDLSMIQCEDESLQSNDGSEVDFKVEGDEANDCKDNDVNDPEINHINKSDANDVNDSEVDDVNDPEIDLLLRNGIRVSPEIWPLSGASSASESPFMMSELAGGMKAQLQGPVRPDSPPVLVVDCLEDYMRCVEEKRQRSRNLSRSSMQSSVTNSAFSSTNQLNKLHQSVPDFTKASYEDDVDLQYLPVSYAGVKLKRRKWVQRSASNANDRFYFSGDSPTNKLGTLRRKIVRKMSKRYKSRESLDGAAAQDSEPGDSPKKPGRKSSIRFAMGRFMRHIRRHGKRSKRDHVMGESTWSLPTNLDSSFSSSDYFGTESEVMPDL